MKYTLIAILALFANTIFSQEVENVINVLFKDKINTNVRLLLPSKEWVEINADDNKKSSIKFTANGIKEIIIHVERKSGYPSINIAYLHGDTLNVEIVRKNKDYHFGNFDYRLKDSFNLAGDNFFNKYGSLLFRQKLRDSIYMDSIINFVVPDCRKRASKALDYLDSTNVDPIFKVFLLDRMYDLLYSKFYFDEVERNYLISKANKYKEKVNDFRRINLLINTINFDQNIIAVKEFRLPQQGLKKDSWLLIDSLAKNNEFILFNLWISSCGPCRKFNKEMSSRYNEVVSKGIQIININFDSFTDTWARSSKDDNIVGVNLQESPFSEFFNFYNPEEVFPQKILFSHGNEFISRQIKSVDDLFKLVK